MRLAILLRKTSRGSSSSGMCGQVKRIEMIVGVERNIDEASADGFAQILVFVFRINDDHFRPQHQRAQNFELHGIAFSGAGFGEDDHIGVFHLEAVKKNETVVVQVHAIENAGVGRKIRGNEGKSGGERRAVHIVRNGKLIVGERQSRAKTLFGAENRFFHIYHPGLKKRFNELGGLVDFVFCLAIKSDIQAKMEESFRPLLQLVAQFLDVLESRFENRIAHFSGFLFEVDLGFHLSDRAAQAFHDHGRLDWMDEHGDIHRPIQIDDRRKPAGLEKSRIGGRENRLGKSIADLDIGS